MSNPSVQSQHKKRFLFVCIGNSCRSQMSEGFARALAGDQIEIFSAGSRPSGIVHSEAIRSMQKLGIDISEHTSKGISDVPQEKYDYVVTMGCGDACPHIPAVFRKDWQIPDPVGQPEVVFESVRDLIYHKVFDLLQEAKIQPLKQIADY